MKSSVLEPCENPTFNFPPLPRRPLRSQTYRTFVQILSHCASLQSHQLPPPKQGETLVQNGCHLVPCDSVALHEPPASFLDGDILKMPSEVSCLDLMDVEVERHGKERDVNGVSPVDSGEENNAHIVGVCHIVDEKKSSRTAIDHEGIIEQKLDASPIVHDYEVPGDFFSHTDTVLNVSAPPQQTDDTSLKDERQLSMKLREFEELICSPAAGDSSDCLAAAVDMSVCLATADDIEEGEVSGDDATMDFLFDSAEAPEGLGSDNQRGAIGLSESDMTGFFSLEEVHNSNNLLETQSTISHLDADKVPFSCEGRVQINEAHKSDSATEIGQILEKVVEVKSNLTAVAEDLALHRNIISKNTTDDGDVLTDENVQIEDVCVAKNEKRKKRRLLSKETKAKKKRKERIKRAEKNRKLGVQRLKLPPVVKAVKVNDCRHYMQHGSCLKGEECRFSHEKIPLTKSTPCRYFSYNSCMKGDDCPFDHQLSTYPCSKYATYGFCHRGATCMFSHEISGTGGALTSSNICKADLKSPVQNSDLKPKKQMNLHGRTHQQFDSSSKSLEKSSGRSSEKILVPDPQKPAAVPKGISMISFGGSSSSSKHDKSSMPVEENVVNLDQQATINSLNRVQKSNEVAKKVPLRPKGVNFLSFGKTPLNASQFDGHHEVGESLFGGLKRSTIFDLPSSGNKTPDDNNQSSLNVVTSKNGTENMISDACTPQGLKFLSFGKKSEDNISAAVGVEQSSSRPNNANDTLPCTQGRQNSFGGPKSSIDMPHGSSCSSNPFSLCSNNSAGTSFTLKESLSSNVPKSAMKALNSTLAFAAKFDSKIKLGPCYI